VKTHSERSGFCPKNVPNAKRLLVHQVKSASAPAAQQARGCRLAGGNVGRKFGDGFFDGDDFGTVMQRFAQFLRRPGIGVDRQVVKRIVIAHGKKAARWAPGLVQRADERRQ